MELTKEFVGFYGKRMRINKILSCHLPKMKKDKKGKWRKKILNKEIEKLHLISSIYSMISSNILQGYIYIFTNISHRLTCYTC